MLCNSTNISTTVTKLLHNNTYLLGTYLSIFFEVKTIKSLLICVNLKNRSTK